MYCGGIVVSKRVEAPRKRKSIRCGEGEGSNVVRDGRAIMINENLRE